ncbi:hypothetical protein CEXT_393341 [Caerostris extrusa]|uniref:Uncharacterized protein n=1 Tax=Caerostris extrusa TaxID=172846 RepID=A0AAV4NSL2_CAEEX|nr:hypothetical protein CEXT_393341 [Caerostris extrusa]
MLKSVPPILMPGVERYFCSFLRQTSQKEAFIPRANPLILLALERRRLVRNQLNGFNNKRKKLHCLSFCRSDHYLS